MFWLILAISLWGFGHSFLASNQVKESAALRWGKDKYRFYRLGYNIFACLSFVPIVALMFFLPDRILYRVPMPWMGLMIVFQLAVLLVLIAGLKKTNPWKLLGIDQYIDSSEAEPSELKTTGLYHFVRHPIYLAGILFIWLMPFMTKNSLAVAITLTVYIVVGSILEEGKLLQIFGDEYRRYQVRTPFLIPFTKWNKS